MFSVTGEPHKLKVNSMCYREKQRLIVSSQGKALQTKEKKEGVQESNEWQGAQMRKKKNKSAKEGDGWVRQEEEGDGTGPWSRRTV